MKQNNINFLNDYREMRRSDFRFFIQKILDGETPMQWVTSIMYCMHAIMNLRERHILVNFKYEFCK